jgi:hypothetical protein
MKNIFQPFIYIKKQNQQTRSLRFFSGVNAKRFFFSAASRAS